MSAPRPNPKQCLPSTYAEVDPEAGLMAGFASLARARRRCDSTIPRTRNLQHGILRVLSRSSRRYPE